MECSARGWTLDAPPDGPSQLLIPAALCAMRLLRVCPHFLGHLQCAARQRSAAAPLVAEVRRLIRSRPLLLEREFEAARTRRNPAMSLAATHFRASDGVDIGIYRVAPSDGSTHLGLIIFLPGHRPARDSCAARSGPRAFAHGLGGSPTRGHGDREAGPRADACGPARLNSRSDSHSWTK